MNYKILAFCIALAIVAMSSVLFVVVSQGANHARSEVLRQQEDLTLRSPIVTVGLFSVSTPEFSADGATCTQPPFVQEAYMSLILQYRQIPRSCTYWVNEAYVRTDRDLAPNCVRECPVGEFSRTIPLGEHDIRDNHVVRVCCNDICVEHSLRQVCDFSGDARTSSR